MKFLSKLSKTLLIIPFLLIIPDRLQAHPVSYEGGLALMGWNSPMMTDYWANYSVTSRFAVTGRYLGLRSEDGNQKRDLYLPQVNYLLKRWNEPGSQANIYLSAAYGYDRQGDVKSGALLSALEADWESRRYYVSGKYQIVRASQNEPFDYARFRVGVAPYVAEFDELHTWIMLQVEEQSEYFAGTQITPLLRFFHQNVLWEVGASTSGNWMFNFMVHF